MFVVCIETKYNDFSENNWSQKFDHLILKIDCMLSARVFPSFKDFYFYCGVAVDGKICISLLLSNKYAKVLLSFS